MKDPMAGPSSSLLLTDQLAGVLGYFVAAGHLAQAITDVVRHRQLGAVRVSVGRVGSLALCTGPRAGIVRRGTRPDA